MRTAGDVTARVRLARAALVHEQRRERLHTLRVENDHAEPVDVIFEIPRVQGRRVEPRDNVTAIADDGTNHRITVTAAGHATVETTVLESWPLSSEIDYEHLALEPPPDAVILRSYALAVERAFATLGPGQREEYLRTTGPPPYEPVDAHLVADAIPEGNPRAW